MRREIRLVLQIPVNQCTVLDRVQIFIGAGDKDAVYHIVRGSRQVQPLLFLIIARKRGGVRNLQAFVELQKIRL